MVLCYHAVSPSWPAALAVTPDALERQLASLIRDGWRGTSFTEAVLAPRAQRTLAVTFDDAFASVGELARPILSSLGLAATVFVPTSFPSDDGRLRWTGIDQWEHTEHAGELRAMTWDQIGELAHDGWEIGSHTHTHPRLTTLDDPAVTQELLTSRLEIDERLGLSCSSIAYPYGDVNDRVARASEAAGYQAAAALSSHLAPLGAFRWPRIGIYHADSFARFRLKAWRPMRSLRASVLWPRDLKP
jgi:peptidoglycan/xylan/chitin deacetylase (PgdA/CDA1 family)